MGNSQRKEAKTKKHREEEPQNVDEDDEEIEQQAEAFLDLEIWHDLRKGSETTFPMRTSMTITLEDFKADLKQVMKLSNNVAVYREDQEIPLGPAHLSLEALQIESGSFLRVVELDAL